MWYVCMLSHVWLLDPMDLPGFSVHGIFQVRILEWIAISFSNKWLKLSFTFTLQASLVAQTVKNLPVMWETQVQPLGREDPLEEGMATQYGILAWRIPWTDSLADHRPWGHRVGPDWSDLECNMHVSKHAKLFHSTGTFGTLSGDGFSPTLCSLILSFCTRSIGSIRHIHDYQD